MWSPQQHRIRTDVHNAMQCTLARHASRSSHGPTAAATASGPLQQPHQSHTTVIEKFLSVVFRIYTASFYFLLVFLSPTLCRCRRCWMLVRHALLSQPQETEIAQYPTTPKVPSSSSSVGGERLTSQWLRRGRHVGSIATARTGISLFLLIHMRSLHLGYA